MIKFTSTGRTKNEKCTLKRWIGDKGLRYVFLAVLFALVGCGPPEQGPCTPCTTQKSCGETHICAHGFCLPKEGLRCTLPTKSLWIDGQEKAIDSCNKEELVPCKPSKDSCKTGTTRCINGVWDECRHQENPLKLGKACVTQKGLCKQTGKWICQVDTKGEGKVICPWDAKAVKEESCNGEDDNCDGQIDEALSKPCYDDLPQTKGVGPCKEGSKICQDGQWSACQGATKPKQEECNDIDDDCNGKIDDGLYRSCYTGPQGSEGVGPCKAGQQRCLQGKWSACQNAIQPTKTQGCEPSLNVSITDSLVHCSAIAQSESCGTPSGSCQTNGKKVEKNERQDDLELTARCYTSHTMSTCGIFATEGKTQRKITLNSDKVSHTIDLQTIMGTCACNNWCAKGCTNGPGCCLTCNIVGRHCAASTSYTAEHHFKWKKPLPKGFPIVISIEERTEKAIQVELKAKLSTSKTKPFTLKKGERCYLVTDTGCTLKIGTAGQASCATNKKVAFKAKITPTQFTEGIKPCF